MNIENFDILSVLKPELAILIPVCWGVGLLVKSSKIKNKYIPIILATTSVIMATLYTFADLGEINIAMGIFASVTQGIGYWAAAWLGYDKIIKKFLNKNNKSE